MSLLVPGWLDLATWAGVIFAALALIGFGRLLALGRAAPETALVAGWGAAALALTLWGVAIPLSLRLPALAIVGLGAAGLVLPRCRPTGAEWRSLLRIVAVALPLWAMLASARPSLPDTFLNLLPNAAYLYDHGFFPADTRPPAFSFIAGAPYNMQLAAFVAGLVTPGFPASAMIGLNLVLQLAAGLLLARLVAGSEAERGRVPGWGATALGFLLAMALNPGFVPRYDLSAYSEPSVTVSLAFAGWLAAALLQRLAAGQPAGRQAWLLALVLAALVNIKQESVALVAGILVAAGVLAILAGTAWRRGVVLLASAALPAIVLYLSWRWYVLGHFAVGELKPLPPAAWQFGALPLILRNMAGVIGQKIFFFGILAAAFAWGLARLRAQGLTGTTRVAMLLLGVFVVYDAALVFAYIALFPGSMGTDAHSYFRYNTHLSLLLMVVLALLARDTPEFRSWAATAQARRFAPSAVMVVALAVPVAFLPFLRFDIEVPQLRVWDLAREAGRRVGDAGKLALLLPGDNGSVQPVLEGLLRFIPPRHAALELLTLPSADEAALAQLDAEGYGLALLSCAPAGFPGVTAGNAAILRRDAAGWATVATWAYPPAPRGARWSRVLADAPLCLGG